MSGCGSNCGWCGACSEGWEGGKPLMVVHCIQCEREMDVDTDDRGPYWCDPCWKRAVAKATDAGHLAGQKGAA